MSAEIDIDKLGLIKELGKYDWLDVWISEHGEGIRDLFKALPPEIVVDWEKMLEGRGVDVDDPMTGAIIILIKKPGE